MFTTTKLGGFAAVALSLCTTAAPAAAVEVQNTLFADGNGPFKNTVTVRPGGRVVPNDQAGSGYDHSGVAVMKAPDGKVVVVVTAQSNEVSLGGVTNIGVNNAACYYAELTPDGIGTVSEGKFLTNLVGDRYRSGMKDWIVAVPPAPGEDMPTMAVAFWGYAPGEHAEQYARVIDGHCNDLGPTTKVVAHANDNCNAAGANNITITRNPDGTYKITSWGACNGNGSDDGWYEESSIASVNGQMVITRGRSISVEPNEERTRGITAACPDGHTCFLATEGNTQPGNSVRGYMIGPDGLKFRKTIAPRTDGTRRNQVTGGPIGNTGLTLAMYQEGEPGGRRRGPGTYQDMMTVVQFATDGLKRISAVQPVAELAPGFLGKHATGCGGIQYGEDGSARDAIAFATGSMNGNNGPARLTVFGYNATLGAVELLASLNMIGSADVAYVQNALGNNPNTQGRGNIGCVAFDNPFYGVSGKNQDVKSFLAVVMNPHADLNGVYFERLGLAVSLVPLVRAPGSTPLPGDVSTEPTTAANGGGDLTGGCSTSPAGTGIALVIGFALLLGWRRKLA